MRRQDSTVWRVWRRHRQAQTNGSRFACTSSMMQGKVCGYNTDEPQYDLVLSSVAPAIHPKDNVADRDLAAFVAFVQVGWLGSK